MSDTSNAELEQRILEVNQHHKMLKEKVEALVRFAKGDRTVVYQTTLSDGGEVRLRKDVTPLFDGAKAFQDRWKLSEYCAAVLRAGGPSPDRIVEVGVETGNYSSFLADLMSPEEMLLLDLKFTLFKEPNNRDCMVRVEGFSSQTLPNLEDGSISFAYIDAAHDFKSVAGDIEAILPKMRKSGIMQFNDYATFNLRFAQPYGVKAAVNNLINSRRVSVVGYGLCPLGFDDVAVMVT